MGRVGVLDGAAVGEVEFAGFRVRKVVRGERGRGDGESHSCDGGKCEFLEHGLVLLCCFGNAVFRMYQDRRSSPYKESCINNLP